MKKKLLFVLAILILPLIALSGQRAVLEYYEGNIRVVDATGFDLANINFGDTIQAGSQILTGNGSAEISLQPNGTIIRLTPGTVFTLDAIQGAGGASSSEFTLAQGRTRVVAARSPGADYRFRTSTAVGGVRGTDFGLEVVPGQKDQLFVKEGSVEFTDLNSGQSLLLGAGQAADTFAELFQAINLGPEQLADLFSGLDFIQLDPMNVPGQDTGAQQAGSEPGVVDETAETSDPGSESEAAAIEQAENVVMDWLLNFLGVEVGSVTINGQTYGKAVLQPKFEFGKFRTQLYLPIIYTNDLFNPDNWYRPDGNDEWSFGTDQDGEILPMVLDIVGDLLLKFKYLEIGDYTDPFFLKLGNVESMTLGHGILINGYANDADFPAIRRLGFNLGLSGENLGFELMVNDLARPEIFGTRFVWRPGAPSFPFGLGISLAADIDPTKDYERALEANQALTAEQEAAAKADPMFFNLAFDLDFPILRLGAANLTLFGDIGVLLPYLADDTSYGGTDIEKGLQFDSIFDGSGFKNFGIQAGVFGNILIVDYRLEFQYYTGAFIPNFYNQPYDRIRGQRAEQVLAYLADPEAQKGVSTMGIYGSGQVNILPQLNINLGYKWPWVIGDDGAIDTSAQDYFHIGVEIKKGLLPLGISGLVQYDRVMFRNIFNDPENFTAFDENTTVKGSIGVEISPLMDLVLSVGTAVVRDGQGVVQYDNKGRPKYAPTVSLETKIGLD